MEVVVEEISVETVLEEAVSGVVDLIIDIIYYHYPLDKRSAIYIKRPSKTDSAPVRGDGYKPSPTQSQRRDVAQRADRTWW
jgi:hypothetical protein